MRYLGLGALVLVLTVAVQAQMPQRGEVVRVEAEGAPATAKVIAVAGDRLRIEEARLYVNDVAVGEVSAEFLARLAEGEEKPLPDVVPADHYVAAAEVRTSLIEGGWRVSRYLGLAPTGRFGTSRTFVENLTEP